MFAGSYSRTRQIGVQLNEDDQIPQVTEKTIRDAVANDQPYPEFPEKCQSALDKLWMVENGVEPAEEPFSEENYLQLLKHFGLPYSNWGIFALSLVLALKYVPKFDTENQKVGRPEKWQPFDRALLYSWVRMKRQQKPEFSINQILRNAKKLEGHLHSSKDLKGNYYKAKKSPIIRSYDDWLCCEFSDDWPQRYVDGELVAVGKCPQGLFSSILPGLQKP